MKTWKALLKRLAIPIVISFLGLAFFQLFASGAEDSGPPPVQRKNRYQRSRLTSDESEAEADHRKLVLSSGEDKAVDLDFDVNAGAAGISYGNPTVVATTLVKIGNKRQLVFKPLKAGETTVTVRDTDGTMRLIFAVRVMATDLLRTANELRNLLRDVEGVEIRVVGAKVIVEGELIVPADYGKLLAVVQDKAYSDTLINLATLSPMAVQVMAKKIQDDLTSFAPNVKTRVVNGMIFLEGTVDNADSAKRAAAVASLYLPDLRPGSLLERDPAVQRLPGRQLIQNFILVNPPSPKKQEKMIRVTVHFVELSKDYSKLFGFKWQPGFTSDPQISVGQTAAGAAGASSGGSGTSFTGTISSLLPKLQSAQTAGYARVLKTATVIVRSGQPAKLNEQQELSYPQAGQNGQVTSATKTVGLSVAVTPLIVGQSEDIQMDILLDQTDVVGKAPSTGGPPVTAVHKVETKLYVKSGESAAVAGVSSTDIGTNFNKDDPLPGSFGQDTVPLFSLLRSKVYTKKKSQFVVFVTPQIIENASDGTEDLKRNFRIKVK